MEDNLPSATNETFVIKLNREMWQRNSFPPLSEKISSTKPSLQKSLTPNSFTTRGRKRKVLYAFGSPCFDARVDYNNESDNDPFKILPSNIAPNSPTSINDVHSDHETESKSTNFVVSKMKEYITKFSNCDWDPYLPVCENDCEASALGTISFRNICRHIINLQIENVQRLMRPIITELMTHPRNGGIFNVPVKPMELCAYDYFEKISRPMDLGTIKNKLASSSYENVKNVIADIDLVFTNAMSYNPSTHGVHQCALELRAKFSEQVKVLEERIERENERRMLHTCHMCQGKSCGLCGEKCLKFDLPDIACHGPCGERIRKNHTFFVSEDGYVVYCQKCHQNLHPIIEIHGQSPILKKNLIRRKLDDESNEEWVQCPTCSNQYHGICVFQNNCAKKSYFECPLCKLGDKPGQSALGLDKRACLRGNIICDSQIAKLERYEYETVSTNDVARLNTSSSLCNDTSTLVASVEAIELTSRQSTPCNLDFDTDSFHKYNFENCQWKAKDLKKSKLSDFLEQFVHDRLKDCGFDNDLYESLTIRVVSNTDNVVEVPSIIASNMATQSKSKVPPYLPYRQKCVLLFQSIDGVDVCLYCLYLQEFDSSCPPPNNSVAYVAYLDSVDYFRPPEARTIVYHEMLVGYLKWIQCRGFKQCHIWSCPPRKGDNFIFWRHPSYQKTPQRDRLNRWYEDMLRRCKSLGIVQEITTLYDKYFQSYMKRDRSDICQRKAAKNSFVGSGKVSKKTGKLEILNISPESECEDDYPLCPPIFEGDYWVDQFRKIHALVSTRSSCAVFDCNDVPGNLRRAKDVIKDLLSTPPYSIYFEKPVDPVALKIDTYFSIISHPMDLGTIKYKVHSNKYSNFYEVAKDVRLTFENAKKFNQSPLHVVHIAAVQLLASFEQSVRQLVSKYRPEVLCQSLTTDDIDSFLALISLRTEVKLVEDIKHEPTSPLNAHFSEPVETISRSVSWGCCSILDSSSESKLPEPGDFNGVSDYLSNQGISESKFNENDDSPRRMSRADSVCSITSTHSDIPGRPLCSWSSNGSLNMDSVAIEKANNEAINSPFEKPLMGRKGIDQVMFELARNVQKDKDALFVITFATSNQTSEAMEPGSISSDDKNSSEAPVLPLKRGRGRIPSKSLLKSSNIVADKYENNKISDSCLSLLSGISDDTSDPDCTTCRSFISMRHSLLDMCQFNHYQFDSLRRAKHSSLMLLYHLHNEGSEVSKPLCSSCRKGLEGTRFHCDHCTRFDICLSCYSESNNSSFKRHPHLLTPYRMLF